MESSLVQRIGGLNGLVRDAIHQIFIKFITTDRGIEPMPYRNALESKPLDLEVFNFKLDC